MDTQSSIDLSNDSFADSLVGQSSSSFTAMDTSSGDTWDPEKGLDGVQDTYYFESDHIALKGIYIITN